MALPILHNPPMFITTVQECSGYVTSEVCQECVDTVAQDITTKLCPNSKQAIVWYDECMLRYSNQSFFSIMQVSPSFFRRIGENIDSADRFNQIAAQLINDLEREAVSSNTLFANGEINFRSSQNIYGLVQCTSDLSSSDCNTCLRVAISDFGRCCFGKGGATVIRPSCYFRYEMYRFNDSKFTASPPSPLVLPSPPPPSTNTTNTKGNNSSKLVAIIVVPLVTAILSTITLWCFCLRRRKAKKNIDGKQLRIDEVESLQFNLTTIRAATDNFSDANKLGEGGFGYVYKGTLLDGEEIAVKRLSRFSCHGEEEFKNEVVLVAKLQHENLVRLLGFCLDGEEKLLIYEFMPNASLDQFIFDPTKSTILDWETRFKIIGGIAQGLLYLHEDSQYSIIHRDLKASNILLGSDMNPKISDFGTARMFMLDQSQANTSRIVGTRGYMAPEYVNHGYFSVKSDVFSFGVLVLEILSGQKNTSFYESVLGGAQDLLSYAWRHWKNGTALELLDPALKECFSINEVMICVQIGLLCVQVDIADRPTMASIVTMLKSNSVPLPVPSPPAYFMSNQRTTNLAPWSVNESAISELYPR
ncbi:Protein kinase domain [Macleaya cordata]|uniref:Protein kinase domain n=1 Tax=Macleaya cordata TaxID=56857 RepID=A0A200QME0_MACCD|nr:Protein kinase domain [Macleaya cordata]